MNEPELRARLEQVESELDHLMYAISHDLRAPVRRIDGFVDVLARRYEEVFDENGKKYLGYIQDGTRVLAQSIDGLLHMSRFSRHPVNARNVDLSALAGLVANELMRHHQRRKIEWNIAAGLSCHADPDLTRALLERLFANAIKFTQERPVATINFGQAETRVGVSTYFVRDNGVGFDMKFAGKLFSPFQRLHGDHEYPGLGFGLAIVQRCVRRHNGKVWVEADTSRGATFFFTLAPGN